MKTLDELYQEMLTRAANGESTELPGEDPKLISSS